MSLLPARAFALAVLTLLYAHPAASVILQDTTPEEEVAQTLKDYRAITPGGENAFGETIHPASGELSFLHEDIVLEGIGPTITLARTTRTQQHPERADWPAFGDWDLSVPRIETLLRREGLAFVPSGDHWRVGTSLARCTRFDAPNFAPIDSWWHGYDFVTPDGGRQLLLKRDPGNTLPLPAMTDDAGAPMVFPALTLSHWQVGCLPQTSNGEPGEGFLAVAPDGTKYWLDHLTLSRARAVLEHDPDPQFVHRLFARMQVTRIEDRFGNWVRYHHDGTRLTGITAKDGRAVSIGWNAQHPLIESITVMPGTATERTWGYFYDLVVQGGTGAVTGARLRTVRLPDGATWKFSGEVGALEGPFHNRTQECSSRTGDAPNTKPVHTAVVTSPGGAVGTFERHPLWRARSYTPSTCIWNPRALRFIDSHPPVYGAYALVRRTVSGPGLPAQTWTYTYSPAQGSTREDACAATGTCVADAWVDLRDPDGNRTRRVFSTRWGVGESQPLRTEVYQGESTLLRAESLAYAKPDQGPWPARMGFARMGGRTNVARLEQLAPVVTRTITQQGVTFTSSVLAFDAFARPLRTQRSNSLSYSRTDAVAYADDTRLWVLGQVASSTNEDTGLVESRTTFDAATALPLATYAFGKLRQTRTWHADGTLASASDGRDAPDFDTTVHYASWKRGVPQQVTFPDGHVRSAQVNDLGLVDWVEDELGYRTCHRFDLLGRLTKVTYPADTPHVCDESRWNPMVRSVAPSTTADFGIPAGHWKEQVSTGTGTTTTHYDALLRPLVVERFDAADKPGTWTQAVTRYTPLGGVSFQSYPTTGVANQATVTTGTRTTYDALGRTTRVEQDSELGALVTKHEYLAGFAHRVTPPGGQPTTTYFQAFDQPAMDQPRAIAHPEGAITDIPRDVFGKPQYITRRVADWSTALTRWYAYNAAQELCRVSEPETGVTLTGYDAAGNVAWSASGLAAGTPCDDASPATIARKSTRTYDHRNRLASLEFADDTGEQAWTYTPDGLPATVWTYNGPGRTEGVYNAYSYNSRRMLGGTGETLHQAGWYTWSLGYGYDRNGFLTVQTYPDTTSFIAAVNALGQTTGISGTSGTYASDVRYHPNGALKQFTYGNGIVHTLAQNLRGLPERSRDAHGAIAVLDDSYDYDFAGNVAAISDGIAGGRGHRTMVYDGLDRLTAATSPMFGGTIAYAYDVLDNVATLVAPGRTLRHCYQANRLAFVRSGANDCASGAATTSLTFDVQGNLASKNAQQFVFSQDNRLREAVGRETYRYDAHGRRVTSDSPALGFLRSYYNRDGQLSFQVDGRQGKNLAHVYLAGSLLATREQPTAGGVPVLKFHHTDALGSPVAVTDGNRTVIERSEYEPFGKVLNRAAHDRPGYTGHVEDRQTGLTYMQQRYFDAEVMRFLSVDPVTAHGNGDLRFFSRYAYGFNNPYTFIDPDGRETAMFQRYPMAQPDPAAAGQVLGLIADFMPIIGDAKGLYEAFQNPGWSNVTAAGVGLVPIVGDIGGKLIKNADTIGGAGKAAPDFVVAPNGTTIPVPKGATGPMPVINDNGNNVGFEFTGGSGGNGMETRVDGVRIMDANRHQGARAVYMNSGRQTVDPSTGRTVGNSDPRAHHYLEE